MEDSRGVHFDLDGAWNATRLVLPTCNLRDWGPRLRYSGPRATVEEFHRRVAPALRPFILYGSGDFHYLAGLWLRQVHEPVVVVSFDNHPDWDVRPPHWGCGGWLNRALERPCVRGASVWGCGNFEFNWPWHLFANHRALRSGRLAVHPWAERQSPKVQSRHRCLTRGTWQTDFSAFATGLAGQKIYVTIDMDCLTDHDAVTNWEHGLFTAADLTWALGQLRTHGEIIAGDVCGAWSPPAYARWKQRVAGAFDHPRLPPRDAVAAQNVNHKTLEKIWPALVGSAAGD